MAQNKILASIFIADALATMASTPALAEGRNHSNNNTGIAIAAGLLGAVVIGSLIANSQQPSHVQPQQYIQPQPSYTAPQVYYQPQPVQQTYYEPTQSYYAPQPTIVVNRQYQPHRGNNYYRGRDGYGYYSR